MSMIISRRAPVVPFVIVVLFSLGVAALSQQSQTPSAKRQTPNTQVPITDLPLPTRVDFVKYIQPILKAHCYECHAGDQNQGGLKLDSRIAALKGGASGASLSPGESGRSLILARVLGQNGKPRMPLGFAPLSDVQTTLLKLWIDQGAVWPDSAGKTHWAYVKPVRPVVPKVKGSAWVRNPIDNFILAKLEHAKVKPNPEADRTTLIRRITLDLTGLPPTPAEVDAFIADKSPNAYEKVVDRLFASPHYGEKMALPWLDTARYADSNGFQQDGDTYQYVWEFETDAFAAVSAGVNV